MKRFSSDHQLLQDLKFGRAEAVQVWYRNYSKPLKKFVSQKITNASDVDEVVQDIFMSCLKHLPLFRGESSIWTWMVHIANHEVADHYRRVYAKKVIKTLPVADMSELPEIEDSLEISHQVKAVLRKMSATSRELLQRKYIDRQKIRQMAKEMDRSVKSVESLLFRARIEFRELYALEIEGNS
jgi:RNA polymerase sigma-70 factor (ECF subfamily)